MQVVNLTPHVLNIHTEDGSVLVVPPDGRLARAGVKTERLPPIQVGQYTMSAARKTLGEVQGLPEPERDVIYIVSYQAAQAVPDREDVFFPGEAVRDAAGNVVGCVGLSHI